MFTVIKLQYTHNIAAVSGFLNSKVRVSTSDYCRYGLSVFIYPQYTFNPRKPLYAQSGVFSLHYYYYT